MKKQINKKYSKKKPKKDRKIINKDQLEGNINIPRFEGNIPRFEGKIVIPIKDILLNVCLDHNNQTVLGYLSGNMRRHRIKVVEGDKVLIELPESTSKKGRIVYRITPRRVLSSNQQTLMEQLEDDQEIKDPSKSSNQQTLTEQLEDDQQIKDPSKSSKYTETKNTITKNHEPLTDQKGKKKIDSKDKKDNQDLKD